MGFVSRLLGIVTAVAFTVMVLVIGAENPAQFVDVRGLVIVLGGSVAATIASYPFREVGRIFKLVAAALWEERTRARHDLEELVRISRMWMGGDVRAVEAELEKVTNPFLRTGVQAVIDGMPEAEIQDLMHWRVGRMRAREAAEAQMFRVMANYAPAFGMLSTLLGLVNLMGLLGKGDVKGIGAELGVALLGTLYGVLLANLVLKPLAVRLERRTERRLVVMNMVMEGISMMRAGRSPAMMQEMMKSFLAQFDDELFDAGIARAVEKAGTVQPERA